jgi:hypothetical protein
MLRSGALGQEKAVQLVGCAKRSARTTKASRRGKGVRQRLRLWPLVADWGRCMKDIAETFGV